VDKIKPGSWQSRFWAWSIDALLMSILWYLLMYIYYLNATSSLALGYYGLLTFLYWTALEGYRGQSIGKMMLNLAVVGQFGESIGFKDAAIESFGKAFLLPLDCLIGWMALPGKGQRLFNRISDTVVASLDEEGCCVLKNREK
jgi:uncharacterized RDD family membrane protein YckC